MRRVLAALLLASCGSEQDLRDHLPAWPSSKAPDLGSSEWTDDILQVTVPQVDVLFTVDDSSSMEDEQGKLVDNFPRFADYFLGSGVDYHIGVTSTDLVSPLQQG